MAAEVYLGLLISLNFLIGTITADWGSPPFTAPDPVDPTVVFIGYAEASGSTFIELDEEVTYNVTIAVLNYTGTSIPTIGTFEDSKTNLLLGAELVKNSTSGYWEVIITNPQDYETDVMQTYRFFIVADSEQHKIALNIQNIDDNAPVIQAIDKSCSVEENWTGTTNCSFLVTDADGWIDQVTFGITATPSSDSSYFNMTTEAISGTNYRINAYLVVTEELDYETIAVYMLVITATDGGGNQGNLTYVLTVIDMPDEPPRWTSIISAENVLEKSSNEFSVSAIDGDIGINAEINYKIITSEERDEEYFQVNRTTGVITVNPIDRDTLAQEVFRFLIVAYEAEDEESAINSTIIIIVEDVNDHIPEVSPTEISIEIAEETYMTLEFDESLVITDPDLAENGQFLVTLSDESLYGWNSAFLVIPNSGYQSGTFTISVVNSSLLDYEDEDWRNITIQIVATEVANSSHIGTRDINIQLINWNDEMPIFENDTVEVDVPEDVEMGYLIATMLATDRDVDDNVTHSLVAQRTLAIDPVTGAVTTAQEDALDYETIPTVVAQIVATDLGDHKTYATLTINVIDVNDVPPSLYMPNTNPQVEEEVPNGTVINSTITATDPDTDALLIFSIDWDNSYAQKSGVSVEESEYRGHLEIVTSYPSNNTLSAEGTFVVTGRLDYETFDVMYLTVVVTDMTTVHNSNSSSARLTFVINDINDNAPIFSSYVAMSVTENEATGALIGTMIATDIDGPGNNDVVYYMGSTEGTAEDLVYINTTTGVIRVYTDGAIDAEVYEYLYYDVIASDGVFNTTESIEIFVTDQNDEIPYLISDQFNSTIYIDEKSDSGTKIVTVVAKDDDRTYPTLWDIRPFDQLFEDVKDYSVAHSFLVSRFSFDTSGREVINTPFNNVSYLLNSDYTTLFQYFSIGQYTGELIVDLSDGIILDRDYGTSIFTVYLVLRDNYIDSVSWNSNLITTSVTVILNDINDQIPELPELSEPAATVSESIQNGTLVLTVTANDADEPDTDNTRVFYEILNVSPTDNTTAELPDDCPVLFRVETFNQTQAHIYANCDLKGYYGTWAVHLYAEDLGTNPGPQSDNKTYYIFIEDYNYNAPVITFPNVSKSLRLSQTQSLNAQLYTYDQLLLGDFTATDEDSGRSGIVTFQITGPPDALEYFTLVSTGTNAAQLQLLQLPDLTTTFNYTIEITATDGGNPPLSTVQSQRVLFISTDGPYFEENMWTAWFFENTTGLGSSVIIPEASDMVNIDADEDDKVTIYYFFTSTEGDMSFFTLDKESRELTLVTMLDREEKEELTLYVVATTDSEGAPASPLDTAILNITIVVVDVNDNAPIFESDEYTGGVTTEDVIGKLIMTVVANDADLNDTLRYTIVDDSMTISDSSLTSVSDPFVLESETGELLLNFKPLASMDGYFSFQINVHDEVNHTDTTNVKVYIVSESNRVIFTFNNNVTDVSEQEAFVIDSFTNAFGYKCNVDYITQGTSDDPSLTNVTSVTTHFIDSNDNLPIDSDVIILASSDLQTITDLKVTLLTRSLYLVDVPTGSATTSDYQELFNWVLIALTLFFFICTIALLIAYIVRTRSLIRRLDKLVDIQFSSQASGLNRIGVVPNSNKHALEGSNPVWNKETMIQEDNISRGSRDSDLMGVGNNPDFSYSNTNYIPDSEWDAERRSSFNPVLIAQAESRKVSLNPLGHQGDRVPNGKLVPTTEL